LTIILDYLKKLDKKIDTFSFRSEEKFIAIERRLATIEKAVTRPTVTNIPLTP
jgi:hypothetical protein